MLDAIRSFVSRTIAGTSTPPESGADTPNASARPTGVQVAAAALLLEIAHADGEFSDSERAHIESALGRHFRLDETTTRELLALADVERRQSIDHFQFTRLIAEQYDLGQKMVLAEVMWGVILADGTIGNHEAYLVRKIAHLLHLEPGYLSAARRAASETPGPHAP
ncbi:MAG: TerB family tellurite resistance protein [Gemmatimonadales bacterium]